MKKSNKFILAAILGAVAYVAYLVLSEIIFSILNPLLFTGVMQQSIVITVTVAVPLVLTFVSVFATVLVYYKAVLKKNVSVAKVLLGSVITALVRSILSVVSIPYFVKLIIILAIMYFGILMILTISGNSSEKKKKTVPVFISISDIEDVEALRESILNAVKPSLKAPLTAVLCEKEGLTVCDNGDTYNVMGNVNSQNSYGAMISTDFTVQVKRIGDTWVVTKTALGVKNAVNYATSFVANYILISIIVAILAAVGFFVMKAIYGF